MAQIEVGEGFEMMVFDRHPRTPERAISPDARRFAEGTWYSSGYHSSLIRTRWVQILSALIALIGACGAIVAFEGIDLATRVQNGEGVTQKALDGWGQNMAAAAGWFATVEVALLVAVLAWLYRIVDNLPALAGGTPRRSPQRAVGWWFVPVADLAMPALILLEVWERYATPSRRRSRLVVPAWWVVLLVSNALIWSFQLWWSVNSPFESPPWALQWLAVVGIGNILAVALGVLGVVLAGEVQSRAQQRAAALGLNVVPLAPAVVSGWPVAPAPGQWVQAVYAPPGWPMAGPPMPPGYGQPVWTSAPSQPTWSGAPAQPGWGTPPVQPVWAAGPPQPAWAAAPAQPAWAAAAAQPSWPGAAQAPQPAQPSWPGAPHAPQPAGPWPGTQTPQAAPAAPEAPSGPAAVTAAAGICPHCGASFPAGVRYCGACAGALA